LDDVKRNRGRPRKNGGKTNGYYIRMTDMERAMLDHLSEIEGKTRTEVLMELLKFRYEDIVDNEFDDLDDDDDYDYYDDDDEFE
jgi:hypothetical protein